MIELRFEVDKRLGYLQEKIFTLAFCRTDENQLWCVIKKRKIVINCQN